MITLIMAVSKNGVIGNRGEIPWYIPDDFKYFKEQTLGKPILMGRGTWDSLPKKPLPNRKNIVLSRSLDIESDVYVARDINAAIEFALTTEEYKATNEIMVIGGEQLYRQTLDMADRVLYTYIDSEYDGDAYFPSLDDDCNWSLRSNERHDYQGLVYEFRCYVRSYVPPCVLDHL